MPKASLYAAFWHSVNSTILLVVQHFVLGMDGNTKKIEV